LKAIKVTTDSLVRAMTGADAHSEHCHAAVQSGATVMTAGPMVASGAHFDSLSRGVMRTFRSARVLTLVSAAA